MTRTKLILMVIVSFAFIAFSAQSVFASSEKIGTYGNGYVKYDKTVKYVYSGTAKKTGIT